MRPASTTRAPVTLEGTVSASALPWPPTPRSAPRREPACSGGRQTCAVSAHLSRKRGASGAGWGPLRCGQGARGALLASARPGHRGAGLVGRRLAGLPTPGFGLPGLTPPLPPAIFCDYYNPPDECEWHYEPCGNRSFETCRTINGIHSNISVSYLEGEGPRGPGTPVPGWARLALLQSWLSQQRAGSLAETPPSGGRKEAGHTAQVRSGARCRGHRAGGRGREASQALELRARGALVTGPSGEGHPAPGSSGLCPPGGLAGGLAVALAAWQCQGPGRGVRALEGPARVERSGGVWREWGPPSWSKPMPCVRQAATPGAPRTGPSSTRTVRSVSRRTSAVATLRTFTTHPERLCPRSTTARLGT